MRLLRNSLITGTVAALLAVPAVSFGPAVVAAASGQRPAGQAAQQPSARFLAQARAALVRYLSHNRPGGQFVHPDQLRHPPAGSSSIRSYNWAGYAVSNSTRGTFTAASGRWTTPQVTCTPEDTLSAEWVGLDGLTSASVEQVGTFGWCFLGIATYFTWYEMYPAAPVIMSEALRPGDQISARVSRSGTRYTLSLTDSTRPSASFTRQKTCAAATCPDTSADWIIERPAFAIGITPLANYAGWTLSGATVTAAGRTTTISGYRTRVLINMTDATSTYLLSSTSDLTDGNSFTTTWHNSY